MGLTPPGIFFHVLALDQAIKVTSRSLEPRFSRFAPKSGKKCHFHSNGWLGVNLGSGNPADDPFSLGQHVSTYPSPKMGKKKIWYPKSTNLTRSTLLNVVKLYSKILNDLKIVLNTYLKKPMCQGLVSVFNLALYGLHWGRILSEV